MATTPTLEAAIAALRSALARVHSLTLERDAAARRRNVAVGEIADLNARIATARTELTAARAAAAAALNQPEPAPGG